MFSFLFWYFPSADPSSTLAPGGVSLSPKADRYIHLWKRGRVGEKIFLPPIVGYRGARPLHFFLLPNLGWSLHAGWLAALGLGTCRQHMAVGGGWSHLVGSGGTKRVLSGGLKKWDESSLYPWGLLSWHQSAETHCEREVLSWCFRVLSEA